MDASLYSRVTITGGFMKKFKELLIASINEDITGTQCERLVKVKNIFESEMLWEKRRLDMYGIQKRLQDWLQGLCSAVAIPYENQAIIEWYEAQLRRKVKEPKSLYGQSESEKMIENYWPQAARTLYELLYN